MTTFIVKPNRDEDFYVMMSEDVPIAWGKRRHFLRWAKKSRNSHFLRVRKDIERRLIRADETSVDSRILKFSWSEDTLIGWRGIGTVRRSELKYVCELLDLGVKPDNEFILTFVDLFPEAEILSPEERDINELTNILEMNGIEIEGEPPHTMYGMPADEEDEEALKDLENGAVPGIEVSTGFDELAKDAIKKEKEEDE